MSLLEGHGNAVMNRLGAELVDGQARMARVLQARRNARGATALLHRLLGLELKMRQYELGESFVNAIEREAGLPRDRPRVAGPGAPADARRALRPDDLARPRRRRHRRGRVATEAASCRTGAATAVELDGLVAPVVVACSGGADSLALLVVAADGAARSGRGARRPRPAPRQRGRRRCRARRGAPARRARPPCVAGGRRARAGTSRSAPATRATPRSRRCAPSSARPRSSSRTPPTTRPRPCCSTCCAAAGRAGSPGCRRGAGIVVRPLLGVRRADVHARVRRARARAGRRPVERRSACTGGTGCGSRRCPRCPTARRRDLVPVLTRQAAVLRAEADLLDELG